MHGHDNFQSAQAFIDAGGCRGLQEQVLLSGAWNLNPWFVQRGAGPADGDPHRLRRRGGHLRGQRARRRVAATAFTHGDLVERGHKGVWVEPLLPGKHPLNTRVMKVELVPTTNIVLNWANRTEAHHYDDQALAASPCARQDGFGFSLDVSQIIHIGMKNAPRVISRVGSMQNLVDHVLQPTVGNYFRNSAQEVTVLEFLSARSERQRRGLRRHPHGPRGVRRGVHRHADRRHRAARRADEDPDRPQDRRGAAAHLRGAAGGPDPAPGPGARDQHCRHPASLVRAEQGVNIAELQANAQVKKVRGEAEAVKLRAGGEAESTRLRAIAESEATRLRGVGEAEAIRAIGNAKAEAYRVGVEALGTREFTGLQLMQIIGDRQVKIVPEVQANGAVPARAAAWWRPSSACWPSNRRPSSPTLPRLPLPPRRRPPPPRRPARPHHKALTSKKQAPRYGYRGACFFGRKRRSSTGGYRAPLTVRSQAIASTSLPKMRASNDFSWA